MNHVIYDALKKTNFNTNFYTYINILPQNLRKTCFTIKEKRNRNNNTKYIPPILYHNTIIIQVPTELANSFN